MLKIILNITFYSSEIFFFGQMLKFDISISYNTPTRDALTSLML